MELDLAHILELVGVETILAALLVGALLSTIHLRRRSPPISLGLMGPEKVGRS
jgi:Kef-type K+ transport system membrane component KefB